MGRVGPTRPKGGRHCQATVDKRQLYDDGGQDPSLQALHFREMVVAKLERGLKLEMLRFEVGDGGEMVVARLERGLKLEMWSSRWNF
ncbi:unnamed protein product [Prunus armeniaca]